MTHLPDIPDKLQRKRDSQGEDLPGWVRLKDFGGGDADMLGGDDEGLLAGGGDEGAAGQMVGFAEESAGTLMDCGEGGVFKGFF